MLISLACNHTKVAANNLMKHDETVCGSIHALLLVVNLVAQSVGFSKLKAILRRVGACTREALQDAIIQALPTITAKDVFGWFRHCGYPAPETALDSEVRGEEHHFAETLQRAYALIKKDGVFP